MSAFPTFTDGPAAGVDLPFRRKPMFLRVVQNSAGKWDVLNNPEDTPELDERIHAYQVAGEPLRGFWDGTDKSGRRTGGMFSMVTYRYIQDQPPDEILRDNRLWQAWVMARPEVRKLKP